MLSVACVGIAAGMAFLFSHRSSGTITVQHDRNPVAVTLSDGSVRNGYTVKLLNKAAIAHQFTLTAEGLDATLAIIGGDPGEPLTVPADGSETLRVTMTMAKPQAGDIRFVARDITGSEVLAAGDRFVTP